MVDDSELDYLRTFLLKVHTAATTKHKPEEIGRISNVADTQRILVHPPEFMGQDYEDFYWKRYQIEIDETSEANLTTALNNIMIGIRKFNRRIAITGFTRPSTMCHVKLGKSTPTRVLAGRGRWKLKLYIDVEWSTS